MDLSGIRPLKVVVDAGNGMGGLTTPAVLGDTLLPGLPLEIVELYFELDGTFPNHPANPLEPENLRDLQAAVIEHGADIGLAFDGDADRCFVIDEKGDPVSPSADHRAGGGREIARAQAAGEDTPVVIHNLITSRAVPEAVTPPAAARWSPAWATPSSRPSWPRRAPSSAGSTPPTTTSATSTTPTPACWPPCTCWRPWASRTRPLSEFAAEYEPYVSSGEINSEVEDKAGAVARVLAEFADAPVEVGHMDGTTVAATDGSYWFNLRPSNTEPFLRFNGEAIDIQTMESIRNQVLSIVRSNA